MKEKQSRPEFNPDPWKRTREHATSLFYGKCAYCETPTVASVPSDIDHFRPKLGAMNLDKRQDPYHYAWLAYTWENLYPACHFCGRNKRSQFPVEGQRAQFGTFGAPLRNAEKALLLDPCDPRDDPQRHLAFDVETGYVAGLTERGETTIALFGLNREPLVYARRMAIESTRARLDLIALGGDANPEKTLEELRHPRMPYAAMVRAEIAYREESKKAKKAKKAAVAKSASKTAAVRAKTETGYITSITIENFRPVRNLSLKVRSGSPEGAGWLMLLGENGAGKTSILQAIALALLGANGLDAIPPTTKFDDLITNGQNEARIRLAMTAEPYTIEARITRGRPQPRFTRGKAGCHSLVLAYGPVRLAGRGNEAITKASESVADRRVANLFDSRTPLTPVETWLTGLEPDEFDFAVTTLRELLHLTKSGETFAVHDGRVVLERSNGDHVRLGQLSAGFGAVIALAVDIMQAAPSVMIDKKFAAGIVLLDEVDAHLHPRWKMEVVQRLREAFPNLQFIACTHEPLCLRGLRGKEVALIRRDDAGQVEAIDNLPSPATLRIDQLLTSPLFGLHTTLDPDVDRDFRRYYELLGNPDRTPEEEQQVADLKRIVDRHSALGYTRRDRLVYEAIDDYLARESKLSHAGKVKLEKATKRTVLRLWRSADAWLR